MAERAKLQTIDYTTPEGLKTKLRVAPEKVARYKRAGKAAERVERAAHKPRSEPQARAHQPRAQAGGHETKQ